MKKIIAGCIQRNVKSQKDLYDRFAPLMLSVCNRYAKNKSDAKDIFQEGFLKVFENIRQLRKIEAAEWWMKRIFVNESFRFYKKQTGLYLVDDITLLENSISDNINENDDILNKMETDDLTRIIQKLPDRMRMIFNMHIIEGFSHKEIADMLKISVGTSKSHLHDARKQLQNNIIIKKIRLYG